LRDPKGQPWEEVIRIVQDHVRYNEFFQNARDISYFKQEN